MLAATPILPEFLLRCCRLPGFGLEIEASELTATEETKRREDEARALQLQFHLNDQLQLESPKHGRACELIVAPCFRAAFRAGKRSRVFSRAFIAASAANSSSHARCTAFHAAVRLRK